MICESRSKIITTKQDVNGKTTYNDNCREITDRKEGIFKKEGKGTRWKKGRHEETGNPKLRTRKDENTYRITISSKRREKLN